MSINNIFAVTVLIIFIWWQYKSRYEGDLVAKCYFAKHKLVWEVLEGGLKSKIEIQWSDIMALKANCPDEGPSTLTVVVMFSFSLLRICLCICFNGSLGFRMFRHAYILSCYCSWLGNLFSSGRLTLSLENTLYGRQPQILLMDKLACTGKIGLLFFLYSLHSCK